MQPARRILARTDTRAAVAISLILLLAISLQGLYLYAYLAMEAVEEADRWVEHSVETMTPWLEAGEPLDSVAARFVTSSRVELVSALRVRDSAGNLEAQWGRWPAPDRETPGGLGEDQRGLDSWRLFNNETFLVGRGPLAPDHTLEIALPLKHFADEANELGWGILYIALGSGVLALLIATLATSRAFAPLRRATEELRNLDANQLGLRLPVRGTRDPVDAHAQTLNRVLRRIDDSFQRLRAFSSDAAHELRTPLNRMLTVSEVALLGGDAEEVQAALSSLHGTTGALSKVVESLLLLAELDDERFELPRQPIEMKDLIDRAVRATAALCEERGVQLGAKSDEIRLDGEPALLDRALSNLVGNAARYATRVEIHASRSNGQVRILVDDDGPGVAPEHRMRIFERFARLEPTERGGEAGVGLALARAVARAHGGELDVEDSPELKGARFVLTLPG